MRGSPKKHKIIVIITLPILFVLFTLGAILLAVGGPRPGKGGCADYGYEWHSETKICTSDLNDKKTIKRLKYINNED
ncbi:MAG: hypothetical protein AAB681_01860 [Patescibacteria group bacterium]